MIPVIGSPITFGLLVLSFILGFIAKTVLPFEYKRFRRQSTKSAEEVKQWNQKTRELLGEVRALSERLEMDRNPNLKEKSKDIDDLQTRIMKHKGRAPSGVSDDLTVKLDEIATAISDISYTYSDVYINIPNYQEELGEIPYETEYDSLEGEDGKLVYNRAVRNITNDKLQTRVFPLVEELEEKLNSE